MTVIKKFTAINIGSKRTDNDLSVTAFYGFYKHVWSDTPETEFDTEEEAIAHAFKHNPYGKWIIAPIITFENDN